MNRIRTILGYPAPGVQRVLYLNTLVSSLGYGLYYSVSSLYLLRVLGYTPAAVGAAVTASLLAGVAISPLVGRLCDRWDVRTVCVLSSVGQAMALAWLALLPGIVPAWIALVVLGIAEVAGGVARGALVPRLVTREERVLLSARLRTAFNFGFCLATLCAGAALASDSAPVYRSMILLNAAAALFVVWQYLARIPRVERVTEPKEKVIRRQRGVRYILFAAASGVVNWIDYVFTVGVPLVLLATRVAPVSLVSVLILINTVLVILLQVPVADRLGTTVHHRRLLGYSFSALGLALAAIGLAYVLRSPWLISTLLIALAVVLTCVELVVATLRWKLRYELAPEGAQGRYSGYFAFGDSIAKAGGPLILSTLVGARGGTGWLWIGALCIAAGLGAVWAGSAPARMEPELAVA